MTDGTDLDLERVAQLLPGCGRRLVDVRERDLSDAVKATLRDQLKAAVSTRMIPTRAWPLLGRSTIDVVVGDPVSDALRWVAELKWCQRAQDKIHEAIWDLFKLALLTHQFPRASAHLITGAPAAIWQRTLCADLFDGGHFSPQELCQRRFTAGARRPLWDELLGGGYDRYPDSVPASIQTEPRPAVSVTDASGTWLLRAARVTVAADAPLVSFAGGWPHGHRPPDARHPPRRQTAVP
jgi:hypothetical protein